MLDFVAIFTKGGITLWSHKTTGETFSTNINNLICKILLEERSNESNYFEDEGLALQYRLDNELDMVYLVVYQKVIKLTYVETFLASLQEMFVTKFRTTLENQRFGFKYSFESEFKTALINSENNATTSKGPKLMRSYQDSQKSKKTVASMIEDGSKKTEQPVKRVNIQENAKSAQTVSPASTPEDIIMENRRKLKDKLAGKKSPPEFKNKNANQDKKKAGKKPTVWELGGSSKDAVVLDRSQGRPEDVQLQNIQTNLVGSMEGGIKDLEVDDEEVDYEDNDEDEYANTTERAPSNNNKKKTGILSYFKGIVGSKTLDRLDLQPALEKMRDHLISKNVAADISYRLCESVATSLEGKSIGTFDSIASLVRNALHTSLVRILSPKRRIDIIRDALASKQNGAPYVISFCGVNGVGKSTNLAKICFWLIENNFSVLIAACDTFRAGAVEQLRTHTKYLNALHPPEKHNNRTMVQLYEKGYGKDAAGIAMEAIKFASDTKIDIVLIDTAGRMQDNEPLMRSLAKLIKVNDPDLVLFVGEALVGNEAVDQLVKFNQSLADYSSNDNPHTIDGIVLTKFDTIDDKVGAAISMTYITGQPIVFVGTGQTYSDLKALNVNAVVNALIK